MPTLLAADHPSLRPDPDLRRAREVLAAYRPPSPGQRAQRDTILDNDESNDLRWFGVDEALVTAGDESVRRLIREWRSRSRGR